MAMASRFLSKSKQIYAAQSIFSARNYAKEAAPKNPSLKGDEMLKGIFMEVKKKYETAIGVFMREKITIDPEDPKAVSHYANVIKTVRKEAEILSDFDKVKKIIERSTEGIPDARSYLLKLQELRIKNGLVDEMGAEKMMMEALDKVEKEIKKPLLRSDKKNTALLMAEFDKINKKLGIKKEDLPKIEEAYELKVAKAQLEELKNNAIEAMETQLKREEFKGEKMPDIRTLDVRNFL